MDTQNTCPPFDQQTANAIAQRTYRIIQADRHAGGANQNLLGCIISDVLFWEYKPDAYCCCFTVIKTGADEFCCHDSHTSRILRTWQQGSALCIETKNTLYRLEEIAPITFDPIQAADLLELYLVNGPFFAGYLYDEKGSAHPLQAFTHTGMFIDSQLICKKGCSMPLECRYFLENGGVRFYGSEFLRRPMLLHNLGSTALQINCDRFCTTLQPKQQVRIEPSQMRA